MSVHNHDEEIMRRFGNTKRGKELKKKADSKLNDTVVDAILKTDIKGLSRGQALKKLGDAIDDEIEKLTGDDQ